MLIFEIISLSINNRLKNFSVVFPILLVYWFLLHTAITISKFILFVCLLLSGLLNSHHRFILRISKNKSIQFVFLHVFYARFYSNLSFYIQLLIHSYPFSTVLNRSQSGPYTFSTVLSLDLIFLVWTFAVYYITWQHWFIFKLSGAMLFQS